MKKMMILAAGIALVATTAQAQLRFGPEAGMNLANVHSRDNSTGTVVKTDGDIKVAAKVGGIVDIKLGGKFSLQPGVFYSMKGFKLDDNTNQTVGGTTYSVHTQHNEMISYVEIPINIQYQLVSPHFFIGVGPYVAFAAGGRDKYSMDVSPSSTAMPGTSDTHKLTFGNDPLKDDLQRMDYGANINLGYMLPCGFFARAQYGLGLANLQAGGDSNNSIKNSVFGITVGMLFGGS